MASEASHGRESVFVATSQEEKRQEQKTKNRSALTLPSSAKRERKKRMLAYLTSERVKRKVVLSHKRERKRKILSCLTSGRRKKQNRDSRSANAKQKKRPA
jgi:hypothetical protein